LADTVDAEASPTTARPTGSFGSRAIRRTLVAFTYRDFRVQWLGACTSSIGTWMQIVAQNWLVLSLTNSPFYLGLDAFLQQLPIMLFTLIGGVLADRRDRRRTLLTSQYIQMATSATLAVLMYLHVVQIWHILLLSFTTGLAQAFGGPAYQSLIPSLVDKKDLPNAVALNSVQFNVARVIGPLLFGATLVVFAKWGYNEPQAMNAFIVLAATTTFLGFSVLTFLPVFAQKVFHKGASTYSHLMAFSGAGSIVGALIIAWLGKFKRMGLTALLMQALYGLCIVAFASSRLIWLSDILLFFTGASLMMVFSTVTSLVQLLAPNEMRGRVMSIYMLAFRGGMPLGSLVSGYFATLIGVPLVIGINGMLLVVVAMYFLIRSHGVREA
jgi:MFS family permease